MSKKERIIELLREGKSYNKIAREVEVSVAYVSDVSKEKKNQDKIESLEKQIKNLTK